MSGWAATKVVAGLSGDDGLVTQGGEVVAQVDPEVLLGATVGRPVVVGEVEVRDATVERPAQDRPLGLLGAVGAEVLPEAERERRQLQPAPAGEAVLHGLVTVLGWSPVTHGHSRPPNPYYRRTHAGHPRAPHRGGDRAAPADARDRRARAAAPGHGGGGHRDVPARGLPHARARRAAPPSLSRGVRRAGPRPPETTPG